MSPDDSLIHRAIISDGLRRSEDIADHFQIPWRTVEASVARLMVSGHIATDTQGNLVGIHKFLSWQKRSSSKQKVTDQELLMYIDAHGPVDRKKLVTHFELSPNHMSQRLRKLRDANEVFAKGTGKNRQYVRVTQIPMPWLDLKLLISQSLASLVDQEEIEADAAIKVRRRLLENLDLVMQNGGEPR